MSALDEYIEKWGVDLDDLVIDGNPDPGSFLGYVTDPAVTSSVLTKVDLRFWMCHVILQHVMYYETNPDGKVAYECMECDND